MNEIVKPNSAMANSESLFDVRSRVESIANDVDLLFRLVEDALGTTDDVEPVSELSLSRSLSLSCMSWVAVIWLV